MDCTVWWDADAGKEQMGKSFSWRCWWCRHVFHACRSGGRIKSSKTSLVKVARLCFTLHQKPFSTLYSFNTNLRKAITALFHQTFVYKLAAIKKLLDFSVPPESERIGKEGEGVAGWEKLDDGDAMFGLLSFAMFLHTLFLVLWELSCLGIWSADFKYSRRMERTDREFGKEGHSWWWQNVFAIQAAFCRFLVTPVV